MPEERVRPHDPANATMRVGLTGGIASGKSAAARVFATLGIPVIDTDDIAREVVLPGTPGLAQVVDAFGTDLLDTTGQLDRKRLRATVFGNSAARQRLEQILHPLIRATLESRSVVAGGPYQVLVIPLLVESGLRARVDRVLVVDCPENLQIERLIQRDQASMTEARAILEAQTTRKERLAVANDVIVNDGDLAALDAQVRKLDSRYRLLATRFASPAASIM